MANFVKTKTAIASVSLIVLILVPLMEANFLTPVVLKRWTKLGWEDFNGISKPLSRYDAGVNTSIYLEYDSSLKRFRAYAAQNNVRSWVRETYELQAPDYLLAHEQYHFNITESIARTVDKLISENADEDQDAQLARLMGSKNTLRSMQADYDRETNHGTVLHRQKRWEFKLDSLLRMDQGWFVDDYSGASIFLPTENQSTLKKWITPEQGRARDYQISAYEMSFHLLSMQHSNYDDDILERLAKELQQQKNVTMLEMDLAEYQRRLIFRTVDSLGKKTYSSWTHEGSNLYYAGASFWGSKDTIGYYQIANSVIRSLKVANLDTLYADDEGESPQGDHSTLSDKRDPNNSYSACFVKGDPIAVGFLTKPVFDKEGGASFGCDFSAVPDSLRFEDFIQIDDEMISARPAAGQQFYVSAEKVEQGAHIMVGYFLKEDTTKKCFHAFREHVHLRRR